MESAKEALRKFDISTLVNAVAEIILLDKSQLTVEVERYIWPRLDFMHGESSTGKRYFILEESYVETEWKDMISVHYINTSYEVKNTVIRVHVFLGKEMSQQAYGGFFTLRKIDEPRIMLSYIYPNWSVLYSNGSLLNVMTYKKKVHILGNEFIYSTYPLFVQDNNTIACAEASMISMSQYLHHKFDYNKIRILDLGKAYSSGKTKLYPASGLRPTQMIEIFNYYNISIGYQVFINNSELDYEEFRGYIDYSVESGLPVILGLSVPEKGEKDKLHIVQIIGHTKQDRRHYVIYDDSGFFLKNGLNYNGFVLGVGWDELKKFIKTKNSFLIYPIHEKVYIPYETFKSRFRDTFNSLSSLKRMESENINLENVRYLLADNREVKKFLREDLKKGALTETIVLEEEKRLLETDMPHYLWVCEIPVKNMSSETEYLFFFANPTYSRVTMKSIFVNKIPILRKEQFGLLNY